VLCLAKMVVPPTRTCVLGMPCELVPFRQALSTVSDTSLHAGLARHGARHRHSAFRNPWCAECCATVLHLANPPHSWILREIKGLHCLCAFQALHRIECVCCCRERGAVRRATACLCLTAAAAGSRCVCVSAANVPCVWHQQQLYMWWNQRPSVSGRRQRWREMGVCARHAL
jgi:hypothetical protein